MPDVLGYLNSKNLLLKRGDANNVHTHCMYCNEDPSSRGRLYVNVDPEAEIPGLYFCHRCQAKGNLTTLKRHYGDQPDEDDLDANTRREIFDAAAAYYQDQLGEYYDVFAYLRGPQRGLTAETIKANRLGYAPMEFVNDLGVASTVRRPRRLYEFLKAEGYEIKDILATGLCHKATDRDAVIDALGGMVTVPYLIAGQVVAIRGRTWPLTPDDFHHWEGDTYEAPKAKYKTCGGTQARLFNTDAIWNQEEVFLTEGEFDALVLAQEGYAAVAVPGANAWQDAWDGYMTGLKRIWLVFDRDAAGEKAAKKLIDRFGPKIRRIHLSEEGIKCDPTMWFGEQGHTAVDFDRLITQAARGDLLITVDEALAEYDLYQGQQGLSLGWEELDTYLRPGLLPGQIMLILAKTGTGKTIMLLNLMQRMRMAVGQRGLRMLFVSLEQTRGEWWDRARRIYTFYNLEADEREAAAFWRENLMIIDRNRLSEAELRQGVDDFTYEMGGKPDVIFLDYLGYWGRAFRGEAYERMSEAVHSLKGIAKDLRVPIIAPHQVSRVGRDGEEFGLEAARDSGVIEETGDYVLPIWTPDNQLGREQEERSGRIHMRIAKSRHGGRGALLSMQFAPVSLVMVPADDELAPRARREHAWYRQYTDDWPRVLHRHRTGDEGHLEHAPDGGFRLARKPEPRRFE